MQATFREKLKKWAVGNNIRHVALKGLMHIINEFLNEIPSTSQLILPTDPRTLLSTPSNLNITSLQEGEYWHHGLKNSLLKMFPNLSQAITISLIVNFDGLPVFASSKKEFWPILAKIAEMPDEQPMVIGIYSGKSKPSSIEAYLSPFVDEIKELMVNRFTINSNTINIQIRCFVCDSPARAFVKGNRLISLLKIRIKCYVFRRGKF